MSIFRSYRYRHTAPIFKLQGNAAATLAQGVALQEKNVFRSSKMSISNSNITTELIADFAAGRLNTEDTLAVQEVIDHDRVIATAALDARRVVSRMNVWLAMPALAPSAPGAGRTRVAYLL
jgi:2,3-bisphosphoglycerate-independent phosphoglycerate mutase